jgi:sensor c-di-GMP phosphodiesterase-like protein
VESHRRRRRRVTALAMTAGLALASLPVVLSMYLARQQAEREQFAALEGVATSIGRQIKQSHRFLDGLVDHMATQPEPCSAQNIAWMQSYQVGSYGVKSVVVLRNGRILCSSSGDLLSSMAFGQPDIRQPNNTQLFIDLSVPGLSDRRFTLLERDGYGVLLYPYGVIAPFVQEGTAVGIFTDGGKYSISHGVLPDNWVKPLERGAVSDQLIDHDAGYFVVRHRPSVGASTAYLAVPLSVVDARTAQLQGWFVPLGVLAGLMLLGVAYLLTRHNLSPRTRIFDALQHNRLHLVYQPVIDLQNNNACIGAEALVRWREPDGSILSPDTFIGFAQEAGLIHLITQRVIELVRDDLTQFLRSHPEFRIGMNVSPSDLKNPGTLRMLEKVMTEIGQGKGRFLVEVTEQGLLEEKSALETMQAIRALGVDIAIDDFGTGYSSLAYLSSYPFNLLKIDRTFVTAAGTDAVNSQIAGHIVELGRTVNMEVVAEGIENEQEATLFRNMGVDFGQGYLFARPMPAAELIVYYKNHKPDSRHPDAN